MLHYFSPRCFIVTKNLKNLIKRPVPVVYWFRLNTERFRNKTRTEEAIFQAQLFWSKHETKRDKGMFQPTWHCCMCCNPSNRWIDFEGSWLIKSSYITEEEMKAYQITSSKVQPPLTSKNVIIIFIICKQKSSRM